MDPDSIIPLHYEGLWFSLGGLCVILSEDLTLIVLGVMLFGGALVSLGYHYQEHKDRDVGDW